MKRVLLQSVQHASQRYETVGDYTEAHGFCLITVSDMANEQYEQLVAVHELIEWILVKARQIPLHRIDEFDKTFETNRDPGDESEPGWDPAAPYHREHVFAEKLERLLAEELGVNWEDYNVAVLGLSQT